MKYADMDQKEKNRLAKDALFGLVAIIGMLLLGFGIGFTFGLVVRHFIPYGIL